MRRVGFVYDPIFLEHDTGFGHPESRARLEAILGKTARLRQNLMAIFHKQASIDDIVRVHPREHIDTIALHSRLERPIDADTICSSKSFDVALVAAGSGIAAIESMKQGEIERAFCAVRPPGHHATKTQAMGFCLFNNIAIAARYAQTVGYGKVAIIDFDVHHGNGTQDIFYDDNSVLYISTHQYPAYPGTGYKDERGTGKGEGYTHNFPLDPMSGDGVIVPLYEHKIASIVKEFAPDLILVSAGYDLHRNDPLASLQVSTQGIANIVEAILGYVDVPYLFMLEGGYDLNAIAESVEVTLERLLA